MTYVIPRFSEFFADFNADLPLVKQVIVVGIAGFLRMTI
jgi:type II secretory pathway component PulF